MVGKWELLLSHCGLRHHGGLLALQMAPYLKNLYGTEWKFHLWKICFSQPCQAPLFSAESLVIVFLIFGSLSQVHRVTPSGRSSDIQGAWSCVGTIGNLGTVNVPQPRRHPNVVRPVSGLCARAP